MPERRPGPQRRLFASLIVITLAACSGSSGDTKHPSAAALVFQVQPAAVAAGAAQGAAIAVGVVDGAGVPVSAAVDVTISLSAAPVDATMLGTITVRSVNGVATFPDLTFPRAGTHRLRAEAAGLAAATSDPFSVSPGPASALAFAGQPSSSATVRAELATPPLVAVRDALGNDVDTPAEITITAEDGPSALAGTTTRTAPDGNAAFPGLSLAEEGTYRLRATAAGLDPALSATVTVVDDVPPASPPDLATSDPTIGSLRVSWTATGDDGSLGTAAAWELRLSTGSLTVESYASATLIAGGTPLPSGLLESVAVTGLESGTTYELGLRVVDGAGNAAYAFAAGATSPCPAGYAGPACTACATGYVPDGGGACLFVQAPLADDVLVTEIMLTPTAPGAQWFEVQNLASYPITLEQAKVEMADAPEHAFFLPSIVLRHGERAVIASAPIPNVAVAHTWPANFSLPLGTGHLRLWGGSNVLEEVSWNVPEYSNVSLQLSSAAHVKGANAHPWYWCSATDPMSDGSGDLGTPGGANGDCGIVVVPPVDYCATQFPLSYDAAPGTTTSIYVRVYEPAVTTLNTLGNDGYPHLFVDIGYGAGSDATTWTWAPAAFNGGYAGFATNEDELTASLSIPAPGTYSYGFRARLRDPATGAFSPFVYCGVGGIVSSNPGPGAWGLATITAP